MNISIYSLYMLVWVIANGFSDHWLGESWVNYATQIDHIWNLYKCNLDLDFAKTQIIFLVIILKLIFYLFLWLLSEENVIS